MLKFKNDIYLTERTKLLEGVLCQTLTFTNANGRNYNFAETSALTFKNADTSIYGVITESQADNIFGVNFYKTPAVSTEYYQVISPLKIKTELQNYSSSGNLFTADVTLTYVVDGNTTIINSANSPLQNIEISNYTTLSLRYVCNIDGVFTPDTEGSIAITYTETYEYQYTISGVENRYPKKPYTITDCVCRCLELAKPLLRGELPKYTFQGVTYSYNANGDLVRTIAEGSQAAKYDRIIAPNFSMSQCTLREQLKIIGGKIHAEPRLGYDPDGTGVNYEENTVYFEEYGGTDETTLSDSGYIYRGVNQSINDYCTDVTTDVANIVNTINYTDGTVNDPGYSENAQGENQLHRTLRTESINIMLTESNAEVFTQYPIYSIEKVECGLFLSGDLSGYTVLPRDITSYVFEAHEYNSVLSSYNGTYPYSKSFGIYYTQGQRNLKGLFYKPETASPYDYLNNYAITNILNSVTGRDLKSDIASGYPFLCFSITYTPIYSSKFSHSKSHIQEGNHEFTKIYAQSESLLESSYYGDNIKGVAERLGNAEETRTYIFPNIRYAPKTGQILKTEKGDMAITAVTTQQFHGYVKTTVALTREFNRISNFVGVNSHKRIAEVSEREAYIRSVLLKEYVVLGDKQEDTAKLIQDKLQLAHALVGDDSDSASALPITCVVAAGTPKKYWYNANSKVPVYYQGVLLPVMSSAFGNTMVFSWNYKDNYSAGSRLGRNYVNGNYSYWVTDIPYCDYYGRLYWYDFALSNNLPIGNDRETANNPVSSNNTFPYPHRVENAPIRTTYMNSDNNEYFHNPVNVQKDSREALYCNYALEFITNRQELIIGSAIASKCSLVGTDLSKRKARVYFFNDRTVDRVTFNKFPNSLNDITNASGELIQPDFSLEIDSANILADNDGITFNFPTDGSGMVIPFGSWCIAYESVTTDKQYSDADGNIVTIPETTGGEIVLACNKRYRDYNGATSETIYINTSNTNLKGV